MSEKCPNDEVFICISLEIIQVGNKTEAITMYVNPYAPVNPAMMGVTQQRLNNYQAQMPQIPAYQQQQFVPQPPMPLMMKGRTVASLDEVKAAQIDLDGSLTYFPCPASI